MLSKNKQTKIYHTVSENTQRPQNVGVQPRHPVHTQFIKQDLALSGTIGNQKVKVRRPLRHFLLEVRWTSCLRNLGESQGNQVVIHPNIERKPLPRFCFQKEPHFALVKLFPGWELTYIAVPAHTGNCWPRGACSLAAVRSLVFSPLIGFQWFCCANGTESLPVICLSAGFPKHAQGNRCPRPPSPVKTSQWPQRGVPFTATTFEEGGRGRLFLKNIGDHVGRDREETRHARLLVTQSGVGRQANLTERHSLCFL